MYVNGNNSMRVAILRLRNCRGGGGKASNISIVR